jgi:hypothetical protein
MEQSLLDIPAQCPKANFKFSLHSKKKPGYYPDQSKTASIQLTINIMQPDTNYSIVK